jgi:hypothetical protein
MQVVAPKPLATFSMRLSSVAIITVAAPLFLAFFDGIKTEDIHETIIKSAADLISTQTPDYQYLAAALWARILGINIDQPTYAANRTPSICIMPLPHTFIYSAFRRTFHDAN